MKVAFLDRDGSVISDYPNEKYPEIDLNNSFYAGGSVVDVKIANHFDLRMFYITNNLNQLKNSKVNSVSNLYEVMNYI